jgi:hypothetical protein
MTKHLQIDIERLKADANKAGTYLNTLHHLEFRRTGKQYRCKQSDGLAISKTPNGKWIISNYSDKLDIPAGDVWTFHKKYYGIDTSNKDGLYQLCKIIADAAGLPFDLYLSDTDPLSGTSGTPIKKPVSDIPVCDWIPNDDRDLKRTCKYQLAKDHSDEYHRMLEYFIDKAYISAATLDKHGVRPLYRTYKDSWKRSYRFKGKNFAFIYKAGDNIKYKQPNAPKGKRERYIQSKGNYCFGYDQLPDTGEAVILAAGETDVLAINSHMNKDGVYAICLNSETTTIPDNLVKDITSRFKRIYVLFDNDKTGKQAMDNVEQERRITAIRISDTFKVNDVCDLVQEIGTQRFIDWMRWQLLKTLPAGNKDPLNFKPVRSYKARTEQYLQDDTIKRAIRWNDKLLIHAPTGSGKSTALLNITKDKDFLQEQNIKRVILCVPTNIIAEQLYIDAKDSGLDPVLLDGKTNDIELRIVDDAKLVISTYDSIQKADVNQSLLVIDEQHQLTESYSYRQSALNKVLDITSYVGKCVLLSATPNKAFCTDLNENFGYTYFNIEASKQKQTNVQPVFYTGSEAAIIKYIDAKHPKGKHLIKKDNTDRLEQMQDLVSRKTTVLSNRTGAKSNSEYLSIIDAGSFDSDFILTTKLLEMGVSILDDVDTVSLCSPANENEIAQFAARPRMKGQSNKETTVYTFHKVQDADFNLNDPYKDAASAYDTLKDKFLFACKDAERANKDRTNNDKDISDNYFNIRYSYVQGKYIPDVLAILDEESRRKAILSDIQDIYKRLQDNDPSVAIKQPISVHLDELQSAPAESKKQDALDLFAKDHKIALAAVKHFSKSKFLRDQLENEHAPKTPEAEALYNDRKLYKDVKELVKKYVRIKPYMTSKTTQGDLIQTILDNHTESTFSLLMSRLQAVYARRNNSGKNKLYDTLFQQMETEIDRRRSSAHRQQRPFEISAYQAKEILEQLDSNRLQTKSGTRIRDISSRKALKMVKTIYDVTYDKNRRKYAIGNKLNISDLITTKGRTANDLCLQPKNHTTN